TVDMTRQGVIAGIDDHRAILGRLSSRDLRAVDTFLESFTRAAIEGRMRDGQ
ncbi:hypothetical protein LCGC14_2955060, partial [marine sediment metagenome]